VRQKYEKFAKTAEITPNVRGPILNKDSSIVQELAKMKDFNPQKMNVHSKIKGIVKRQSLFGQNGGILNEGNKANDTMQGVSTHYIAQVKSVENQRKILGYDTFIKNTRKKTALLQNNNNKNVMFLQSL